jgi:hypothetical protein
MPQATITSNKMTKPTESTTIKRSTAVNMVTVIKVQQIMMDLTSPGKDDQFTFIMKVVYGFIMRK